jgi:hypothetical protein
MQREKLEKLGTIFLAVFSTGLAAQFVVDGMSSSQWLGATAAVLGSLSAAAVVRMWPAQAPAKAR